jgi:hypothetical protein
MLSVCMTGTIGQDHVSITHFDLFDGDGDFLGAYPMVHIPCCDEEVGIQIKRTIQQDLGESCMLCEYSDDEGGFVSVAYQATQRNYESFGRKIARKAIQIRNNHPNTENERYEDVMVDRIGPDTEFGSLEDLEKEDFEPRYIN